MHFSTAYRGTFNNTYNIILKLIHSSFHSESKISRIKVRCPLIIYLASILLAALESYYKEWFLTKNTKIYMYLISDFSF